MLLEDGGVLMTPGAEKAFAPSGAYKAEVIKTIG